MHWIFVWMKDEVERANWPILFSDGQCVLCHWSVNLVLANEKRASMYFAFLQGETAHKLIGEQALRMDGVVFYKKGKMYVGADAVLEVVKYLKYPWPLLRLFRYFGWRGRLYAWVVRNRYAWFGDYGACRLPLGEERKRFLG